MSQRYIGGLIYNPPGGFSGYFDGSGDWLSVANNTALNPGTGDFTLEAWAYIAGNSPLNGASNRPGNIVVTNPTSGTVTGFALYFNGNNTTTGTGLIFENVVSNTTYSIAYNATIPQGVWHHVAVSRSGTTTKLFLNGVEVASGTLGNQNISTSNAFTIGGGVFVSYENYLNGYISNLRLVKGTALYTSAFTPPVGPLQAITNTSLLTCAYPTFRDGSSNNFTITVNGNTAVSVQNPFPLTALPNPALGNQGNGVYTMSQYQSLRSQNLWPAIDPYWEYVTLMLHGNGTNGAQNNTFLDSSTNNFTITRNGNTTQGAFSPYGSNWSNYFDGSGDDLRVASNAAFALGTGDFTFEMWINPPSWATVAPVFVVAATGGFWIGKNGSNFVVRAYGVADQLQYGILPNTNTWTHIVAVRSGTTLSLYYNGSRVATTTNSYNFAQAAAGIGGDLDPTTPAFYTGYVSNLRLVKGSAVYDPTQTTITVPSGPLQAITNTSLLTCQSNRFVDNSTNNFTITRNGDVSVQRFSPFHPTAPYAAGTIGGSGYFDGSGDELSAGSNAAFSFGTGAYTVEAWVYLNADIAVAHSPTIVCNNATNGFFFLNDVSGSGNLQIASRGGAAVLTSSTALAKGLWNHVVAVRSGTGSNQTSIFVNGTRVANGTDATNWTVTGPMQVGGITLNNYYLNGYMSNVRVVKGTAVYDPSLTTLTVPTAPLTAIANTSLLLNFTNGGIIDNAMMNDLETVGNAQISTSVSKFGGGSLAFDGSGDYLVSNAAASDLYAFGSGDFTIEFWLRLNATQTTMIYDGRPTNTNGAYPSLYMTSNSLRYYVSSADRISGATLSNSVWYHIAICRSGTSTRLFVDGVQSGSTYTDSNVYLSAAGRPFIGANSYSPGIDAVNGNIDDLRITKYARYTANFTPQRSQWQDQ